MINKPKKTATGNHAMLMILKCWTLHIPLMHVHFYFIFPFFPAIFPCSEMEG